jgi:hypothetical protein
MHNSDRIYNMILTIESKISSLQIIEVSDECRYKHTMLVDLHNISMSMLMGKKKNLMKRVWSVNDVFRFRFSLTVV